MILMAILLSLAVSAAASPVDVRGTVVDAAGVPVEGAVVLHRASGTSASTGARGEFVLAIPGGARVRLTVVHPDYYEQDVAPSAAEVRSGLTVVLTPLIRQRRDVVVTALRYPEAAASVPVAQSVVRPDALAEQMPANLAEGLERVPGVALLGSGGFSLVPTVRGLSRRRVLFLLDFARIESDRRTGPSMSFIAPGDVDRVEVLRTPASVFYGSDAIGGVVHALTREPDVRKGFRGRASAEYGSASGETGIGLGLEAGTGDTGFLLSFQNADAGNYRSPLGEVAQSQFTQRSLFFRAAHRAERRDLDVTVLLARGVDIGKPNRSSASKPTWYPREDINLVQARWVEKGVAGGDLVAQVFVNPNFLETRTDTIGDYKSKEAFARTDSTEYGAQLSFRKTLPVPLRLEAGADLFGRASADAVNRETTLDAAGAAVKSFEEIPYARGARRDGGIFVSADYSGLRNVDVIAGARYDAVTMGANVAGATERTETHNTAATGFLAASWQPVAGLTAFGNVSRAYRVPSLGERFYTGISGRGYIIGVPGLRPETSLNVDGGLRWAGRRAFAGVYAFRYRIDDMIERYRPRPADYTYGNIERGVLDGIELEAEVFPRPGWKAFATLTAVRGRSEVTGEPLNDVPPLLGVVGSRVWLGRTGLEAAVTAFAAKDNPGPSEVRIPGGATLSLRADYAITPRVRAYLNLVNLFDRSYLARPDPEAMEEPGRSVRLGVSYGF